MQIDPSFEYSLVFAKIHDNLEGKAVIQAYFCNNIEYTFKYEFYFNENQQIILSLETGIQCLNEIDEIFIDTTVKTSYKIDFSINLINSDFIEFATLINDTFNILKFTTKKQIEATGLENLVTPDFLEYSNEFIYMKNEFLKRYFPSPN